MTTTQTRRDNATQPIPYCGASPAHPRPPVPASITRDKIKPAFKHHGYSSPPSGSREAIPAHRKPSTVAPTYPQPLPPSAQGPQRYSRALRLSRTYPEASNNPVEPNAVL